MTAEPNQDETLLRWPRQASGGDYTEPAPSGFFYALHWPLAVMLLCTLLAMTACGQSELQTARVIAADATEAQEQARIDAFTQREVKRISDALNGPRPHEISEADWAMARKAIAFHKEN